MALNPNLRLIVYEGSGSTPLTAEERFKTIAALLERGFSVTRAGSERPVTPHDGAPVAVLGRFDNGRPDFAEAADVRFEQSLCARDGRVLLLTVMEHVGFGLTDTVCVAYVPGEAGVTET